MVLFTAFLYNCVALRPRITLRSTKDPISPQFRRTAKEKAKSVWVDGRDTGVRVPSWEPGFYRIREYSNHRRDLGGEFDEEYRGATDGTNHYLFAKRRRGRFTLLPWPANSHNPQAVGLNAKGALLAVDDPTGTQLTEVTHAYLWLEESWRDLGPALEAKFERGGSIVGSFGVDPQGRPVAFIERGSPQLRTVRFRWKNGKRTESK